MRVIVVGSAGVVKTRNVPVEAIRSMEDVKEFCRGAVEDYRQRQRTARLVEPIKAARERLQAELLRLAPEDPPLTDMQATRIAVAVITDFLRASHVEERAPENLEPANGCARGGFRG